jgi:hypothetical protein
MRGGAADPLSRAEIEAKAHANCLHGGWDAARADALIAFGATAFDTGSLSAAAFRG